LFYKTQKLFRGKNSPKLVHNDQLLIAQVGTRVWFTDRHS
jgi:hypothetical protein